QEKHALVSAGRNDRLLDDEFEEIGERLEQTPRSDHVRAAPDLHRRPDLAIGVKHIGGDEQENDQQKNALREHDNQRPEVIGPQLRHVSYSAAVSAPCPSAILEHSAMMAEARAIGLVR